MPEFEVRLFAHLRDRHGESVRVTSEPRAKAVLESLIRLGVATKGCRLSVNLDFPHGDDPIGEGAELALIPPVSGG